MLLGKGKCLVMLYLHVDTLHEFVCVHVFVCLRANVVVGTRVWSLVTDGSPA
jgi:hypothetical protein